MNQLTRRPVALVSAMYLAVLMVLVGLQACESVNPVAIAETPEQRAFAVAGLYDVTLKAANELLYDTELPDAIKEKLHAGGAPAVRFIRDTFNPAYRRYLDAKVVYDAALPDDQPGLVDNLSALLAAVEAILPETEKRVREFESALEIAETEKGAL